MKLSALIDNAANLPSIPKVVQELIESFSHDDFDIDDIAKKISADQALTAKVLRLANSAKYGGNRNIGCVNDAIVRMGFDALRTLVLASGLTGAFKAPVGFDIKHFWRHSFMVANRAKWVARYTRVNPEIAFTCGMMNAIGDLLIHILLPDQARGIDLLVDEGANRIDLQRNQLGFDYTQTGESLAQRWKFPAAIADGIRWQNQPCSADHATPLAAVNAIAIYLTDQSDSSKQEILGAFPSAIAESLDIDLVELMANIDQLQTIDADIDDLIH
ncbi:HDOD domain-containing protein [Halioxenophilus sp. WMMB6]|uniref:HDOD domain-containing protein n=1 Tax=Halioxenophilus sp. WMMB6 TaxID=3073815 RepID=UPI00295E2DAA|nr:HDOD domain-containing protein [Halioxenophilus sp. WMMB6]